MNDKDFYFFSSSILSLSSISQKHISVSIPMVLSLGVGLVLGLDIYAFTVFRVMVLAIFYFFKHKSIFKLDEWKC